MKYQNGIQIFRIQLSNSYGYQNAKAYVVFICMGG